VVGEGVTLEQARTNIDIGGPCMVRASAKNFLRVASVTNAGDYPALLKELRASGGKLSLLTRYELARKAFKHTADYDAAVAAFLQSRGYDSMAGCYSKT
jgi:phosphoribosylaminoimidazolecarboxamide formyltransferase/IMP cyclohydrolase